MNLTRLTDEPHRPGTPRGVRPATGTPAALAQATDRASRDDAARPGLRPTGRGCHRSSARRGDGPAPSATFAHLASLAYLGLGWSLRARWFHRGFTAAALVPASASRRAAAGKAKPLNRIAHASPRRATWLGRGSGAGCRAQAGRDWAVAWFRLLPGRVFFCCSPPAAGSCLRFGLYRLQLQPLHPPAHVAWQERLEKPGGAVEMDLAGHGEACPHGDGLETVEEQRLEAAVNLPQGDLIGRPDQQLVNDHALAVVDL